MIFKETEKIYTCVSGQYLFIVCFIQYLARELFICSAAQMFIHLLIVRATAFSHSVKETWKERSRKFMHVESFFMNWYRSWGHKKGLNVELCV